MVDSRVAARALFGTAALAAVGFAVVTARVMRGKTTRSDESAQEKLRQVAGDDVRFAAKASGPVGKWYAHLPAALVTARKLHGRGRTPGAITVVATSLGAALLSRALDHLVQRRLPPDGNPGKQSYPNGHALETSALALTSSYVLLREGMAPGWSVAPLGLVSLLSSAGRLLLDRHWTSDVIGGYCAGIAFGATCAGTYELSR